MEVQIPQPRGDYITCSKCGAEKPRYQPHSLICRECKNAYRAALYRERHPPREKHADATITTCTKCGKVAPRARRNSLECRECRYAYNAQIRAKDPDKYRRLAKESARRKHAENPQHRREVSRKWREDPAVRITLNMRASVRQGIVKNGGRKSARTDYYLGYPLARLVEWARENRYNPPHNEIDHIVPFAVWRKRYPDDIVKQQRAAWNLANLQVIPRGENRRKAAKLVTLV